MRSPPPPIQNWLLLYIYPIAAARGSADRYLSSQTRRDRASGQEDAWTPGHATLINHAAEPDDLQAPSYPKRTDLRRKSEDGPINVSDFSFFTN